MSGHVRTSQEPQIHLGPQRDNKVMTLTEVGADGLHYCSWNLCMSLLPVLVLHGIPSVQKRKWEKVVLTCYD